MFQRQRKEGNRAVTVYVVPTEPGDWATAWAVRLNLDKSMCEKCHFLQVLSLFAT